MSRARSWYKYSVGIYFRVSYGTDPIDIDLVIGIIKSSKNSRIDLGRELMSRRNTIESDYFRRRVSFQTVVKSVKSKMILAFTSRIDFSIQTFRYFFYSSENLADGDKFVDFPIFFLFSRTRLVSQYLHSRAVFPSIIL